ncbi:MAG: hypothetical protein WC459_02810 [Patescibacteria group bacterium]
MCDNCGNELHLEADAVEGSDEELETLVSEEETPEVSEETPAEENTSSDESQVA